MNDIVISNPNWENFPAISWNDRIAYLLHKFMEQPQIECPVKHIFEDGKYIREMTIPAQTLFIGRTHRHGHVVELLSGSAVHITPEGRFPVSAPFTVTTRPGYQMVAFIETPVLCRSIHPNPSDSRDVDTLELDAFEPVDNLRAIGRQVEIELEGAKWLDMQAR